MKSKKPFSNSYINNKWRERKSLNQGEFGTIANEITKSDISGDAFKLLFAMLNCDVTWEIILSKFASQWKWSAERMSAAAKELTERGYLIREEIKKGFRGHKYYHWISEYGNLKDRSIPPIPPVEELKGKTPTSAPIPDQEKISESHQAASHTQPEEKTIPGGVDQHEPNAANAIVDIDKAFHERLNELLEEDCDPKYHSTLREIVIESFEEKRDNLPSLNEALLFLEVELLFYHRELKLNNI